MAVLVLLESLSRSSAPCSCCARRSTTATTRSPRSSTRARPTSASSPSARAGTSTSGGRASSPRASSATSSCAASSPRWTRARRSRWSSCWRPTPRSTATAAARRRRSGGRSTAPRRSRGCSPASAASAGARRDARGRRDQRRARACSCIEDGRLVAAWALEISGGADPGDPRRRQPRQAGSHLEHDLAELAAGLEALVGGGDVVERVRRGDEHATGRRTRSRAARPSRPRVASPSPRAAGRACVADMIAPACTSGRPGRARSARRRRRRRPRSGRAWPAPRSWPGSSARRRARG